MSTGLNSMTTLTLNYDDNVALTTVAVTNNTLRTFSGASMTTLKTLDLHGNKFTSFDGS